MQVDSPARIRNIAIAGHNDTGKTTLASSLLFAGGAAPRFGKIEDGNTITDFDPEETERGISIGLAVAHLPWRQHKVNLLDSPGYGIFFSEIRTALRVADCAVVCVNAVAGAEVNTEKVWEAAADLDLPVILHLNKMDRERADLGRCLESLQSTFGRQILPVQLPIGSEKEFVGVIDLVKMKAFRFERDGSGKGKEEAIPADLLAGANEARTRLIEAVAEADEHLLEKFFEEGTLEAADLESGLRSAIAARKLFPVTLGSSLHLVGSSALLDFLVDYAPSPANHPYPAKGIDGSSVPIEADPEKPAVALVFKTLNDPFTGRLSILRVLSGTLQNDAQMWNVRAEEMEKMHGLVHLQGKTGTATTKLIAGDIGGVPKMRLALSGDTLSAKEQSVSAEWIPLPEPAMSFAIEPKSKGDDEKIGDALHRLIEEDPSLRAGRDPQTHEFLLSGSGQLHVEITLARMKRRSNVEVILHPPKVPYRETIQKPAEGHGRHKKQSGGRGQFADCRIK
ncbi:MAG: elongation factor G, partial [Thermoanaerobaculia bacterium]